MKILSIYDKATRCYMRPFFCVTLSHGTRLFSDLLTEPNHEVSRHPEDYSLFYIGEWDDQTGSIVSVPAEHICNAHELAARVRDEAILEDD